MSVRASAWEHRLLSWAYEGLESRASGEPMAIGERDLARAYAYCAQLTKLHSRTFYMASGLLPLAKRRAVRALYAFCRLSDDLVDRAEGDPRATLEAWRRRALFERPGNDDWVLLAWADARMRYRIPQRYAEQLLEGVARDATAVRYATFDDLAAYCYGVASTVGLMAMHIIGFVDERAISYAVKLGVALQLTNILRDVGEDWRAGRVYLPQEELVAFGLSETDIAHGCIDERWRAFLRFQIARARRLYAESLPGVVLLHPDGRFAVAAAGELYRAILDRIEANRGDVFRRRAYLSHWDKLRRLPGIWWRTKALGDGQGRKSGVR
jgi:phytoene synthase